MDKLKIAREKINNIDREMAKLFVERMRAAEDVAEYKKKCGLPIFDAEREQALIERNSEFIEDTALRSYYIDFLKSQMDISKKYQHRLIDGMRVAYSGIKGAFAESAANRIFSGAVSVPYPDFAAAYDSVVKGECDCVVLPIENSFAGDVNRVIDLAFEGSLYINGVYDLEVIHNLLVIPGTNKKNIKTVMSHPQALSQCAPYIAANGYEIKEATNTAIAAKTLKEMNDRSVAVIASRDTAELYGLEIAERKINESNINTTRFAVFSKCANVPSADDNHFVLFFTVKNEAGSLGRAVSAIGKYGFNMRTLKSHPTKKLNWEYYFFAEGNGNINGEDGKRMLEALRENCEDVRIVGVFESEKTLSEG